MPHKNMFDLAIDIMDDQKVGVWVRMANRNSWCNQMHGGIPTVHARAGRALCRTEAADFEMKFEQQKYYIRRRPLRG